MSNIFGCDNIFILRSTVVHEEKKIIELSKSRDHISRLKLL